MAVDGSNRRRKFIFSGSSNLLLMKQVTETLAGRALYFELLPMTFGEEKGFLAAEHFLKLWDDDYDQAEQMVDGTPRYMGDLDKMIFKLADLLISSILGRKLIPEEPGSNASRATIAASDETETVLG